MGTIKKAPKEPQGKIKCVYRASVDILVRNVDIHGWEDFVVNALPDTYEAEFTGEVKGYPLTALTLSYEVAGANAEDIFRRLRTISGVMHYVPIESYRRRICGCPPGTLRCAVRTND